MNIIPRDDIAALVEHCRIAKADFPQIFVRYIKSNGFPMKLDGNGEKIRKDVDPVLPIRTLWILPKEKVCHRCGHEYEDVPGEPKEKICEKCMEKYKGFDMGAEMPGWLPVRESATKKMAKTYMEQARALTGVFPVRFRNFMTEDGLKIICKVMRGIDNGACDTKVDSESSTSSEPSVCDSNSSKIPETKGASQTPKLVRMPRRNVPAKHAIDANKISLRKICEMAWIDPVKKEEYRPDFLKCERPVV